MIATFASYLKVAHNLVDRNFEMFLACRPRRVALGSGTHIPVGLVQAFPGRF
jgi:hypothetical protein